MSKATIAAALALPPAGNADADRDAWREDYFNVAAKLRRAHEVIRNATKGDAFIITADQLRQVMQAQRSVYDLSGYHTFDYWRKGETGMAGVGEYLCDLLEEDSPALFREIWNSVGVEAQP